MVNGTTYCAAFGNASGNGTLYYDDGSAGDMSEHGGSGALPATWSQDASEAYKFGEYATFTPPTSAIPIFMANYRRRRI